MDHHPDRAAALSSLRERWGAAAPRPATEVFGALAVAPHPAAEPPAPPTPLRPTLASGPEAPASDGRPALVPLPDAGTLNPVLVPSRPRLAPAATDRAIPTGFPALDALLAAGGFPRAGTVTLAGAGSSGATTLALRVLAEAQVAGALAAWVDLPRALDPVEAVARGVNLEWLAVLVPDDPPQALAMAGALLQARAVDILVLDLGTARAGRPTLPPPALPAVPAPRAAPARRGPNPPALADQLARLVAFARRAGALLLVLEPAGILAPLRSALDEGAGLRLELRRSSWIRLGREVVGQQTEIRVAKDHHGIPGRRTVLRILYAEGGPRDRCLARDELLAEEPVAEAPPRHLPAGCRHLLCIHFRRPAPTVTRAPPIDRCASSTSPGRTSRSGSPVSGRPETCPTDR